MHIDVPDEDDKSILTKDVHKGFVISVVTV